VIALVRGRVAAREKDALIVEVGAVGYRVFVPRDLLTAAEGTQVALFTHMVVREDDIALYGFASAAERRLFARLLAVSGVGPKLALALLGALPGDRLAAAIRRGDRAALVAVPGVGRKTAERLFVELKDALEDEPGGTGAPPEAAADEAFQALVALGVRPQEAYALLGDLPEGPTEERVRQALRRLGGEGR
jgi:Holliday junction DNA helicase RuvA